VSSGEPERWRIGLTVTLSGLGLVVAAAFVGRAVGARERFEAVTYLDESVAGLIPGQAPVTLRGIEIGEVVALEVAGRDGPGGRRPIKVTCAIYPDRLVEVGAREDEDLDLEWEEGEFVPPELRALLAPKGITGGQVLQLDLVDPARYPAPDLGEIDPPWNYVPAVRSTRETVEDTIPGRLAALPDAVEQGARLVDQVSRQVDQFELPAASRRSIRLATEIERALAGLDVPAATRDASALCDDLTSELRAFRREIDALEGRDGDLAAAVARIDGLTAGLEAALARFDAAGGARSLREASARLRGQVGDARGFVRRLRGTLALVREVSLAIDAMFRPLLDDPGSALRSVVPIVEELGGGR